jgi:hypothetical protein
MKEQELMGKWVGKFRARKTGNGKIGRGKIKRGSPVWQVSDREGEYLWENCRECT